MVEELARREELIKNHREELEKNFKQVYPNRTDLGDSVSDLQKKYHMVYGAPGNNATAAKFIPLSDFQNAMGRKDALKTAQNGYRNDPQLRSVAASHSPKEILNLADNPQELGKELGKLKAQKQQPQKVVEAPAQKKDVPTAAPQQPLMK